MRLIVTHRAEAELRQIVAWYESERAGLGDVFWDECIDLLDLLVRHPNWGTFLRPEAERKARLKRFPYAVLYRVDGDQVVVLAVGHQHRRPGFWS